MTTHWTAVVAAGRGDTGAVAALETLCRTYWYPLYAYLRRRGDSPADAEDLTQGFFERLLRLNSLTDVKKDRGKFRSFLLASLNHYIADEWDRASAAKRDLRKTIPLDAQAAETRYRQEPANRESAERVYERQWALALLEVVVQTLSAEYDAAGKSELFRSLRFTIAGDRQSVAYAELAKSLKMSEPAIRVAVHRLRRRYRETLRQQIAQTVAGPDEVEAELRSLFAAVS